MWVGWWVATPLEKLPDVSWDTTTYFSVVKVERLCKRLRNWTNKINDEKHSGLHYALDQMIMSKIGYWSESDGLDCYVLIRLNIIYTNVIVIVEKYSGLHFAIDQTIMSPGTQFCVWEQGSRLGDWQFLHNYSIDWKKQKTRRWNFQNFLDGPRLEHVGDKTANGVHQEVSNLGIRFSNPLPRTEKNKSFSYEVDRMFVNRLESRCVLQCTESMNSGTHPKSIPLTQPL